MSFENILQAPISQKEVNELLKNYSLEEREQILDQMKTEIYSTIKNLILSDNASSLSEKSKNLFLTNLKEEDFELASKLNS